MSGHDFECQTSRFTSRGGEVITNRKSSYPDHLILQLTRDDAWHVVHELLNALRHDGVLPITLLGQLKDCKEE